MSVVILTMFLSVITLFPKMFHAVMNYGMTKRAIQKKILKIKLWDLRDFTYDRYRKTDDRPYGGGPGMVMMAQPLLCAINKAKDELCDKNIKIVYLSPQGIKINQKFLRKLVNDHQNLILICGRYLGIDHRLMIVINEEWSIGDYILSGGELASMVLIDSISRMLPGVLGNMQSKELDSFSRGILDCPYYTRPERYEDMKVPSVLLSGNHNDINRWKLKQALGNTWIKRPDLLNNICLTSEEEKLLIEFKNEYLLSLQKK